MSPLTTGLRLHNNRSRYQPIHLLFQAASHVLLATVSFTSKWQNLLLLLLGTVLLVRMRSSSSSFLTISSSPTPSSSSSFFFTAFHPHTDHHIRHTTTSDASIHRNPTTVVVVAHVVSLIKCHRSHRVRGFLDAAAVLRHSIHQQSNYTNNHHSHYSYQMVALVHPSCQEHNAALLQQLGYITKVVSSPISLEDLPEGSYLRGHVEAENCCGKDEFMKLYAYTLTEYPIVVHWDMDVLVLQPMDHLFDAMLFPSDSRRGQEARQQLQVQHPHVPLPNVIDAYITRDITSSRPWEIHQGVQGGFVVTRPNQNDFDLYMTLIQEANYSRGRGVGTGWGNLGYGGFQGAMAYQGVLAYFYDQIKPHTAVELNVCRWNQVAADVIWRGPLGSEYNGTCREYPKLLQQQPTPHQRLDHQQQMFQLLQNNTDCEDCRMTPIELVNTVHYTACKKPWECQLPFPRQTRNPRQQYAADQLTNVTTCGLLFRKWFEARKQVEDLLANHTRNNYTPQTADGGYYPEYFMGFCKGSNRYLAMKPLPADLDVNKIYF